MASSAEADPVVPNDEDEQSHGIQSISASSSNDSTGAEAGSQPSEPAPRVSTTFWHLPREIRQIILTLACQRSKSKYYHPSWWESVHYPGLSTSCSRTINALSLTSRGFYADMMPVLYANVRLTRPSDVCIFTTTLNARPSLGQLVRKIHVGSDDVLDGHWWPLERPQPTFQHTLLRINMVHEKMKQLGMPTWLFPAQGFYLEEGSSDDPLVNVVRAAIEAASQSLNVDLLKQDHGASGDYIGSDKYHILVLEVQSALELYLAEMGQRDAAQRERAKEDSPTNETITPRYPRLVIQTEKAPSRGPPDEDVFWLSHSQIVNHLTRRRAPADRLDHPLLFARSGMPWAARDSGYQWHEGETDELWSDEDGGSGFGRSYFLDVGDAGIVATSDGLFDPLNPALPNTATLGGILALTRSLFSFTPFVESVSLTGFLERLFCGSRPAPALKSLKSLSIGPSPPNWFTPLRLDDPTLAQLESLRVCGHELFAEEIAAIAGSRCVFKNQLRVFQWCLAEIHRNLGLDLRSALQKLLVIRKEDEISRSASEEPPAKRSRREGSHDNEPGPTRSRSRTPPNDQGVSLYIELSFHHSDVETVLTADGLSQRERTAWRTGGPLSDRKKRLRIIAYEEDDEEDEGPGVLWWMERYQHQESRDWWENGPPAPPSHNDNESDQVVEGGNSEVKSSGSGSEDEDE